MGQQSIYQDTRDLLTGTARAAAAFTVSTLGLATTTALLLLPLLLPGIGLLGPLVAPLTLAATLLTTTHLTPHPTKPEAPHPTKPPTPRPSPAPRHKTAPHPETAPRPESPGHHPRPRLLTVLTTPQRWAELLYALTAFIVFLGGLLTTLTWWTLALAGLSYPLYGWALPYTLWTPMCVLIGLAFAVTLPKVITWCLTAQHTYNALLLTPRPHPKTPTTRTLAPAA
ncbi:hypothetical protein [Nonomuraea sp. NPDC050310]|uniref:hypothetical protein n=1 Tax=Nonomuraea sp. NPDC050310 TaxID=3154935 RepID=UPI0033D7F6B9